MSELLELAQRNSACAVKTKENYKEEVFKLIDSIILRASEYEGIYCLHECGDEHAPPASAAAGYY